MTTIKNATRKQLTTYIVDVKGYDAVYEYGNYTVQDLRQMLANSGHTKDFESYTN